MEQSGGCRPKGNPGSKTCILSFDGGGVRGIISSVILERLESHLQVMLRPCSILELVPVPRLLATSSWIQLAPIDKDWGTARILMGSDLSFRYCLYIKPLLTDLAPGSLTDVVSNSLDYTSLNIYFMQATWHITSLSDPLPHGQWFFDAYRKELFKSKACDDKITYLNAYFRFPCCDHVFSPSFHKLPNCEDIYKFEPAQHYLNGELNFPKCLYWIGNTI